MLGKEREVRGVGVGELIGSSSFMTGEGKSRGSWWTRQWGNFARTLKPTNEEKGIFICSCPGAVSSSRVIWGALIREWQKYMKTRTWKVLRRQYVAKTQELRERESCSVSGMLEDLVEGWGLKVGWHAQPSRTLPRETPAWERGMWSNGKSKKKKKIVRDLGNRRGIQGESRGLEGCSEREWVRENKRKREHTHSLKGIQRSTALSVNGSSLHHTE